MDKDNNTINIEQLLVSNNISYKISGSNLLISCFFHIDNHPSLSINREGGFFKCFSCGQKGSYLDLYKLITGNSLNFSSVNYNMYKWNKPLKNNSNNILDKCKGIKIFGKLQNSLDNKEIRDWLFKYGVEDDEFIIKYEIKYSTYVEMISLNLLEDTSIEYTKMVNRIIIPIHNEKGNIINYEGRTYIAGVQPKVLYVKGGSVETLYNWNTIDITKPVIVCEGIKGLWRIYSAGYTNVVAMMHSIPSEEQLRLLNTVENDIIAFIDNDHGGWGQYEKGKLKRVGTIQSMAEGLEKDFKVCYSPIKGFDPNDCTKETICMLIDKAQWNTHVEVNKLFMDKKESW